MSQRDQAIQLGEMQVEFEIDGRSVRVPARAIEELIPEPHVFIEVSDVPRIQRSGPILSDGPSKMRLENGTDIDVVPFSWMITQPSASLPVAQSPCVALRTNLPIATLEFSVLNFSWRGRQFPIALQAPQWNVTIEPVPDLSKLEETLRSRGGYAITHLGRIDTQDGRTFSEDEAQAFLRGLDHFLSFVCGSHCAITNVVGRDGKGNEVWKRWGAYQVSSWRKRRSWFDFTVGGALPCIYPTFWKEYLGRANLIRVLDLYAESNVSESIDISIILTQVALEVFASWHSQQNPSGKTGERIADALNAVGIDTDVPSHLVELENLRKKHSWCHGPHSIVEVRNSLVHAGSTQISPSTDAYYEAKQLGLWYLELLLLNLFKHAGQYASRLEQVQTAGKTEWVPWAK